jgi:hypothetical protein
MCDDVEQIKKLKAKYCYYVDGYFEDPSKLDLLLNEVFADDASIDFGAFGSARGREEIKNWFLNICFETLSFSMHLLHNPVIEVLDDNRATGMWYFLVPCTLREDNTAGWLAGIYDEEYEKRGKKWYIKSMKVRWIFATPFDKGWAKENLIPE